MLMTMGANFVVAVDIPTDRNPDYWVSMGAAMLCALVSSSRPKRLAQAVPWSCVLS